MDIILIILLVLLVGLVSTTLYLNLRPRLKDENENKEAEERAILKTEIITLKDTLSNTINTSLGTMSTSFNNLSTGVTNCLLYTSPSPRDGLLSRMPSSA